MKSLLLTFDDADLEAVRQAAAEHGMTMRGFCRRAVLDSANQSGDVLALVRQIHRAVVSSEPKGEGADAAAALIDMGWESAKAKRTASQIAKANPQAQAADIIRQALSRN